jgi:hypothetical protein
MKNPPCQSAWRVSENICELYQLFSSFLRGASRPKSPRYAVLTATLFMLEAEVVVKMKVSFSGSLNNFGPAYVQDKGAGAVRQYPAGWTVERRDASYTVATPWL